MKPRRAFAIVLLLSALCFGQSTELEQLRHRANEAAGGDCARLSMQVARRSLEDAHHWFRAGDNRAAHDAIDVALHYGQRSVDCAVESRKHQKEIEIELRGLVRRLREVARTVDVEERPQLARSVEGLEKQRDRLLQALFGPTSGNVSPRAP